MDKKTLLAVVISVVVIVAGMLLQNVLFPARKTQPAAATPAPATQPAAQPAAQQPADQATQPAAATPQGAAGSTGAVTPVPVDTAKGPAPLAGQTVVRETDLFRLTFLADGGTLASVQLKQFRNLDGSPVDMLLQPRDGSQVDLPFAVSFGDYRAEQRREPFVFRESTDGKKSVFEFSRDYYSPAGVPFTLKKSYVFLPGEYLFEMTVTIANSVNEVPALDAGGLAYTLTFGPQIGPSYKKLDGKSEFREFSYWLDGKRQDPKVAVGAANVKELDKNLTWAAVGSKYFAAIVNPLLAVPYRTVFDSRRTVQGFDRSVIHVQRPAQKANAWTDKYHFYLGPVKKEILESYNSDEKNSWGVTNMHAEGAARPSGALMRLFGWLGKLLGYVLEFLYKLIPNYGVAIILLTLFTKLIFFPLTIKSSESTAKMASLNPKMQEIRARLKDKPDKMNQEIAALYKREGINPMSGCLPLLLQLPIFFALYDLLNTHFELRGALFIPGWIPDLSVPESVLDFGFTIPLVNWSSLRLLPLIMLGTQLLSGKITQPAGAGDQQGGMNMKLMTYALPIVFLFILYDMPSGLVLYWTVQNVLSIVQQWYMNSRRKAKAAAAAEAAPPAVKGRK
jgi:YidC/Oxa1 family membrane protein insertase